MENEDHPLQPQKDNLDYKTPIKKSSFNISLIAAVIVAVGISSFFAGLYISDINSNHVTKEDLDDAIARLELKMLKEQLPKEQPRQPVNISADDDPVRGNQDAPITIIEFSDFQCPFCARFHIQTLPLLLEEYIETGKAKLVYRDFPIQSIHPNAMPAAVASECADDQGKYWEFHDKLFETQSQWNKVDTVDAISIFSKYALEIGLELEQFNECLSSGKYVNEVRKDLDDGRNYGVTGTPGFFVGNEELGFVELKGAQPFESFKKVIDSQLNK